MSDNIEQLIAQKVQSRFNCKLLNVDNESHMHNVPVGSESHFKVHIVSDDFEGQSLINRHRSVNEALADVIPVIHALALHTHTPAEYDKKMGHVAASPPCLGGGK